MTPQGPIMSLVLADVGDPYQRPPSVVDTILAYRDAFFREMDAWARREWDPLRWPPPDEATLAPVEHGPSEVEWLLRRAPKVGKFPATAEEVRKVMARLWSGDDDALAP